MDAIGRIQGRMTTVRRLPAVLVVSLLFVFPASPASANEPDASHAPRTSGPLVGVPWPCEDNGPAEPGEAKGQSCSWAYELAPAETNAGEDFSAFWIQMEIDPGKGWCAKEMRFELTAPTDGRIVSAAPDRGSRITKSSPSTTELVVDGEAAAPVPGTIAQDIGLTSGRTKVEVDEDHYSFVWRGNSRTKVMVAIGVQFAHNRVPPETFYSFSGSEGAAMGSCRTPLLRARPH